MFRTARGWLVLCVIAAPAALLAQTPTPQPDTSAKAVIEKARQYLKDYKEALQFVLADEATSQTVFNRLGREVGRRQTSGEYFLTYIPSEQRWVGVRDVAVVDGVPVQNRENLRELLTKASFSAIGRLLADRNASYNIGNVVRNMNDPMFTLIVLDDRHRDRFKFERRRVEPTPSGPRVTINFEERDDSTLVRGADNSPIRSRGQLVIDAVSGRVMQTVLTLKDKATTGTLTTVFTENQKLGIWLPASMEERYDHELDRRKELVVAKSTYTNYRRFNVSVVIK